MQGSFYKCKFLYVTAFVLTMLSAYKAAHGQTAPPDYSRCNSTSQSNPNDQWALCPTDTQAKAAAYAWFTQWLADRNEGGVIDGEEKAPNNLFWCFAYHKANGQRFNYDYGYCSKTWTKDQCPGSQPDPENPGVCVPPSANKNDVHANCATCDEQDGGG